MKLHGVTDGKLFVASIAHYDYRVKGELMADGGQSGTAQGSGYHRGQGKFAWYEVPQNFAELYDDYNYHNEDRKYGVWDVHFDGIRTLSTHEIPDTDSIEWKVENAIWGTRTFSEKGQQYKYVFLKDCETAHLRAILHTERPHHIIREAINHLLEQRKNESN